jgi:hypothetical protein
VSGFLPWLLRPIRVELPGRLSQVRLPSQVAVPVDRAKRPAGLLATGLPVILMVGGVVLAVLTADWSEQSDREGIGTLGVEAGAAFWFAGAITLGLRRAPTLLRAFGLAVTAIFGVLLVALALALDWTGAELALAMEFGVGALAVVVIDVVLLGILHPRIEHFADDTAESVVRIRLAKSWHIFDVRVEHRAEEPLEAGDNADENA